MRYISGGREGLPEVFYGQNAEHIGLPAAGGALTDGCILSAPAAPGVPTASCGSGCGRSRRNEDAVPGSAGPFRSCRRRRPCIPADGTEQFRSCHRRRPCIPADRTEQFRSCHRRRPCIPADGTEQFGCYPPERHSRERPSPKGEGRTGACAGGRGPVSSARKEFESDTPLACFRAHTWTPSAADAALLPQGGRR